MTKKINPLVHFNKCMTILNYFSLNHRRWIGAEEVYNLLGRKGSKRSIQRVLNQLASAGYLDSKNSNPKGFRINENFLNAFKFDATLIKK